jgi:hypothetical protein
MPPGEPPANSPPFAIVAAFPPERDALLSRISEMTTDDMLVEISKTDYGMDADEHLSKLRQIRDTLQIESPLHWKPGEVLELARWSEPDVPQRNPQGSGQRRHVMRAFCCAALLRAAADPANDDQIFVDSQNEALLPLIESALFLNDDLPSAAARFMMWRIETLTKSDDQRPFFAFGLLSLALLSDPDRFGAAEIDALAAFVDRAEILVRDPFDVWTPGVLSGSFMELVGYKQHHPAWRALATRLDARFRGSSRLSELLQRIRSA